MIEPLVDENGIPYRTGLISQITEPPKKAKKEKHVCPFRCACKVKRK